MCKQSDSISKLVTALVAARAEFAPVRRTATNPHFRSKYATLDNLHEATSSALGKHGLAVIGTVDGDNYVATLCHISGEWIRGSYPLGPYTDPQKRGASLTYARRYSESALLGVAPDDDLDGEDAKPSPAPAKAPQSHDAPAPRPKATETVSRVLEAQDVNAPCPMCKVCGTVTVYRKAGVTKQGKEYPAFFGCPDKCRGGSWDESEWESYRAENAMAEASADARGSDDEVPF